MKQESPGFIHRERQAYGFKLADGTEKISSGRFSGSADYVAFFITQYVIDTKLAEIHDLAKTITLDDKAVDCDCGYILNLQTETLDFYINEDGELKPIKSYPFETIKALDDANIITEDMAEIERLYYHLYLNLSNRLGANWKQNIWA